MKNFFAQYTGPFRFVNASRNLLLKLKHPHVLVGRQAVIRSATFEKNAAIGNHVTLLNSTIGNHTYISPMSIICNAAIGRFCSIGAGVKIGLGIHPSTDFISTHPAFYSLRKQSGNTFVTVQQFKEEIPVVIGHDVWVGANAVIIDGVKIGNGAIVAAGAVVTKDVEPYEIVGGVPAAHIRRRFEPNEIKKLQAFEWWNKDEQWLRENASKFRDKQEFLAGITA